MADVTGTIGNEQVELNNAATEATLKQILAAIKGMNQSILKMTPAVSGGGGAGAAGGAANTSAAGGGIASLASSAMNAAKSFNPLMKIVGGVTGVLGGLVSSALSTGKNLLDLGQKAMEGSARMSDFYGAMKDLPLGLGIIAGLFERLAKIQEANLDAYREISKSGVNFAGSLTDLRMASMSAYLTLDQFQELVKKNSETFAMMGTTANDGAKAFIKLSHGIIDSNLGDKLMGLGYTTQDINQSLANYIKMTGGRTAAELKDTAKLSAAAGEYMSQLDRLAQITGESRAAEEEKLKQATQDAQFEALMQGMDEESRKKAMAAMANALATGGKGAADALKAKLLGIPPVTEAAQNFVALYPKAAGHIDRMGDAVTDQKKGVDEVNHINGQAAVELAKENKAMGKETRAAITMSGGAMAQTINDATKTQNMLNAKNIKTADDYDKMTKEITDNQNDRRRSEAAAMAESEKALKDLGTQLWSFLNPIIKALTPVMSQLVSQFTKFIGTVDMGKLGQDVAKFATAVIDYVKNLFSPEGRAKIINDIIYYMKLMFIEIKKAVIPWYSDADAEEDKARLKADKDIIDARAAAATEINATKTKQDALQLAYDEKRLKELEAKKGNLTASEKAELDIAKQHQAELEAKKKQLATDEARINDLKMKGDKITDAEKKELEEKTKSVEQTKTLVNTATDLTKGGKEAMDKAKADIAKQSQDAQKGQQKTTAEKEEAGKQALKQRQEDFKDPNKRKAIVEWQQKFDSAPYKKHVDIVKEAKKAGVDISNLLDEDQRKELGYASGTIGHGGNILKDFGPNGSRVKVGESGREAILNEQQLTNLAKGIHNLSASQTSANMIAQMKSTQDKKELSPAEMYPDLFKEKMATMPSMTAAAQSFDSNKTKLPNPLSALPDQQALGANLKNPLVDAVANFTKSIQETVTGTGPKTSQTTPSSITAEQGKNLITELQTLNKQTGEVLRYIRDTADHTKKTVDATRSLHGNLFA